MKGLWTVHLTSLLATTIWIAADPEFETMTRLRSFSDASASVGWTRITAFILLVAVAIASLIALLMRMFCDRRREPHHRSIRQLLAITTVIALWSALATHHGSIAWQGKRVRFAFRVDELETIAAPLRSDWPKRDGELSSIGPFMAYPFGRPTTLVLLQAPRVARRSVYVSSIERSGDGALKLQLTGSDGGAWAEWHPPGSRPTSFTGGLADRRQLVSATAIGNRWYLVRYLGGKDLKIMHGK